VPIKKINIEEFLSLAQTHAVIDVRSPGEYTQAHIPGAYSLPLFSDEERKKVGTAYKQQSREAAIKIGLDFFGVKMRRMVEQAEKIIENEKLRIKNYGDQQIILIHCWRGGMRSMAVAWLLDLYGFNVYTLAGGYKRYRNWVLAQFTSTYRFKIVGGYTGSGKTLLLHELEKNGHAIIDIEALANHKGSALGGLGKGTQPRQEMFENLVAGELSKHGNEKTIFVEDESQRIGDIQIPMALWYMLRESRVLFLDIPFEERLNYLTAEYGLQPKEKLVNAIMRIQKRLGGLETKNAINFLLEDNFKESFRILLRYYDKYYLKGLHNRENTEQLIRAIHADKVNTENNIKLILQNLNVSDTSKVSDT
jgi:tRNA 2-selenouridine synthase